MSGARTLTLDIETSPLTVHTWSLFKPIISVDQIVEEWSILSVSAKWLDEPGVVYIDTSGRGPKKVRDDKALCGKLWKLLDEADIVVVQNGQKFDIPKINARLIMHGYKPYSPIKIVDTKIVAKRVAAFSANSLAWFTTHLTKIKKDKHKNFPGFELWTECLKDNPAAWAEMRKYNILDTLATEELYRDTLRGWTVGHPNVAAYALGEEPRCPKCSSLKIRRRGLWYTQSGEYQRWSCNKCGGWFRTRYTENSLKKRHSLFSN